MFLKTLDVQLILLLLTPKNTSFTNRYHDETPSVDSSNLLIITEEIKMEYKSYSIRGSSF